MTAGLKTLELIAKPGFFEELGNKTGHLINGLVAAGTKAGIPVTENHVGGMFGLFFSAEDKVTDFAQATACNQDQFKAFFHAMLDEGVYLAPSAFEAGFVSAAHSEADLASTLTAADKAFNRLADQ